MARGHHYRPTAAHKGHEALPHHADGGSVSHHEGKHHVAHHGDHDVVHHHHYARGGEVGNPATKHRIPEERGGGPMESYTAKPNLEEEEASGAIRKRGGAAKKKRARGGSVSHHDGKHHVVHHGDHDEVQHHHHADGGTVGRARGGKVAKKHVEMEGPKTRHRRLDRPGRKRGGGIGSNEMPLSTAARARPAGMHHPDADELAGG